MPRMLNDLRSFNTPFNAVSRNEERFNLKNAAQAKKAQSDAQPRPSSVTRRSSQKKIGC